MTWLLKAIMTGVVSFAATNIDDIFVLTLFFGQTGRRLRRWHIVAGQYFGFTALVAISLVGYFARLVVSPAWVGLLGLLPVAIGVRGLLWRGEVEEEKAEAVGAAGVLSVAAVTFANGGDNVGIYTPLFAASDLATLLVILAVFFVMLAVWCVAGYFLGNHPAVRRTLDRYGHIIVPFLLIGLGVYIMLESGTLKLLGL
ncbi:MAG TPA: cadmium resistance transporter [Pyrinomonadaceae bacterium]|nr:cadmium resistance transporter [Pyrinomonadaceae bacterium]